VSIKTTSVADAIAFDPDLPSTIPIDLGSHIGWDVNKQSWVASDLSAYHRQLSIPDVRTTTLNGTLTLIVTDNCAQVFNGTASGYTIILPNANSLYQGWKYEFYNTTDKTIVVKDGVGTTLFVLAQNTVAYGYLQINTTVAGVWLWFQVLIASTASGIINYNLTSSTAFSTTSTTDVLITGFSLIPEAGTYAVWYNASSFLTTTPKYHYWSIYKDGVQISDSERRQDTAHSDQTMTDSTMSVVYFDGTQTCDIRVRTQNGTLTINQRSLLLIRLGT
jgi:hypothetical protein